MLRIGMIGTGRIAQRFVKDILLLNDVTLTCVYNPHSGSAKEFVTAFCEKKDDREMPTATEDWNVLESLCDAVYVATPHETHYDYGKKALKSGKHVLCEKPMTMKAEEANELFQLAEERGLILREAVKTAYCPGFLKLLEVARSGAIGDICDVEACFTKLEATTNREIADLETGGSVTELGTYGMLPIFKLLGCRYKEVQAQSLSEPNGVDKYTKLFFTYDNAMATAKMGLGVKSEGQLLVSGTKGYILAESPWWMTKRFEVRYENPKVREVYEEDYIGAGLVYEIIGFVQDCLGTPIGAGVTKEETISMIDVMENFLQSDMQYRRSPSKPEKDKVAIWAHRGMSQNYPENTILAFEKAAEVTGIRGIELDVQLSKDGEVVVFHDETLDRVTQTEGRLTDFTLKELKQIKFRKKGTEDFWNEEEKVCIPTFEEVLCALKPYCEKNDLMINVELKTSIIHYPAIEEKTYQLVKKYKLEQYIIYSSFWAESVKKMKEIDSTCKTGMLATKLSDCIKWGDYAKADALHPCISYLDCDLPERWRDKPIRSWNCLESLYHKKRKENTLDLREYVLWGVTDIFTNKPNEMLN